MTKKISLAIFSLFLGVQSLMAQDGGLPNDSLKNDPGYQMGYHITNIIHYALYAGFVIALIFMIRKMVKGFEKK